MHGGLRVGSQPMGPLCKLVDGAVELGLFDIFQDPRPLAGLSTLVHFPEKDGTINTFNYFNL